MVESIKIGYGLSVNHINDTQAEICKSLSIAEFHSRSIRSTIVDLREKNRFSDFHIQGSVHQPAVLLVNRVGWKNESLILVGDGFDDDLTAVVCARLKENGFQSVTWLRDGLQSWADNKIVDSRRATRNGWLSVPPSVLSRRAKTVKWVLIDTFQPIKKAREPDNQDRHSLQRVSVEENKVRDWFSNEKNKLINDSGRSLLKYVLTGHDDARMEGLAREIREAQGMPVYYLAGGMPTLKEFEKWNEAIVNRKSDIPEIPVCRGTN